MTVEQFAQLVEAHFIVQALRVRAVLEIDGIMVRTVQRDDDEPGVHPSADMKFQCGHIFEYCGYEACESPRDKDVRRD